MKRIAAISGMFFIAAFCLAAAVWDGSAVAGGAGDFPDEGLYGACNSFPRDTSVTVTNLENGKTVTVIITQNVDNPGVFIALSPKAAAALGMRAGAASRIRATALVASQTDTSLPPTRAGETADPDYNPKVYVEREKAAVAAAAAAPVPIAATSIVPAASVAPPSTPAQSIVSTPKPETPQSATQSATQSVEVLAKVAEPKKEPAPSLPSLTEPKPAGSSPAVADTAIATTPVSAPKVPPAAVAAAPAPAVPKTAAPKAPAPKVPADNLPLPEASPAFPGSPRPSPLGMSLPTPDTPSIPSASTPTARGGYLALAPEVLGDAKPQPRKTAQPRLVIADPALPSTALAAAPSATAAKAPDKASVVALSRPPRSAAASTLSLAEPVPEFAPDELPDAILSRVMAPAKIAPNPVLAEVQSPSDVGNLKKGPEAITFDKPSYAGAVEAAALADAVPPSPGNAYSLDRPRKAQSELSVAELAEVELPGSPDAIAERKAAGEGGGLSELQVPDLPRPSEGIAAEKPRRGASGEVAAELAEPNVNSPSETGSAPSVIADGRKGPGAGTTVDLSDPSVPTPTESLTAGKPNAVAPGEAVAELSEPDPNRTAAAVEKPSGPETATAVASDKPNPVAPAGSVDLASPAVPSPTESIAAAHPAAVPAGSQTVTLEPASPRPPLSSAPASPVEPKPAQPAAVATIKGQTPAGAAQAPASVPMLKGLAKGSFYVQIGVYGTNDALRTAIAGFKSSSYPLAVEKLTTKAGAAAYRLFVGPLSRDESGVVLIRIRSLGFKDAYVRQGT